VNADLISHDSAANLRRTEHVLTDTFVVVEQKQTHVTPHHVVAGVGIHGLFNSTVVTGVLHICQYKEPSIQQLIIVFLGDLRIRGSANKRRLVSIH